MKESILKFLKETNGLAIFSVLFGFPPLILMVLFFLLMITNFFISPFVDIFAVGFSFRSLISEFIPSFLYEDSILFFGLFLGISAIFFGLLVGKTELKSKKLANLGIKAGILSCFLWPIFWFVFFSGWR